MPLTDEKIRKVVADPLGVKESEVAPTADFVKEFGADSLKIVEPVMALVRSLAAYSGF